jgi:hypothetical protein
MALGATGTALAPTMSSGLGNIQAALGTPNASGGATAANGLAGMNARPPTPGPGGFGAGATPVPQTQPGNVGSFMGFPNQPSPPAPNMQAQPAIGQIMAQLHPQAAQALRAIPRDTMQHLTRAGLMHPGVMNHLYGQQQ